MPGAVGAVDETVVAAGAGAGGAAEAAGALGGGVEGAGLSFADDRPGGRTRPALDAKA